ncbi:MAG: Sua5 family C-terminal domain-containing protein, partial [Hyphomonas sp.]
MGIESTILAVEGNRVILLRSGAVPVDRIEAVIGRRPERASGDAVTSPGMLKSHYAPKARLRMNALQREAGEAYLGFGLCPVADMSLSPT